MSIIKTADKKEIEIEAGTCGIFVRHGTESKHITASTLLEMLLDEEIY